MNNIPGDPTPHIEYKTWKDRAENIGVQCTDCGRTHWIGTEETTNPLTGQPCLNCQAIKDTNILIGENNDHKKELLGFQEDLKLAENNGVDPTRVEYNCSHTSSSQPTQVNPIN